MIDFVDYFEVHVVGEECVLVHEVEGGVHDEIVLAGDGVGCGVWGCCEFCGVEGFVAADY